MHGGTCMKFSSDTPLKFREDGTFHILMISDLQETYETLDKTLTDIVRLIDKTNPDLLVIGGDIVGFTDPQLLKPYLDKLFHPIEERGLYWMHIFGNHDHDLTADSKEITKLYEQYAHCLSDHEDTLHGATNYVVPVSSADGEHIRFTLWGLDTNNTIDTAGIQTDENFHRMKRPEVCSIWDFVHFDQLMWYWNTSAALEQKEGEPVPGIMFTHVAPWEFQFLVDNPELTGCTGSTKERMGLSYLNSGLFAAVLQRKDICCIACGHSHDDDFDGTFCGIRCCMDASAGYSPYGEHELKGGRVFIIKEDNPRKLETYTVKFKDL